MEPTTPDKNEPRKSIKGTHRPDCPCNRCKGTRKRSQETLDGAAGTGGPDVAPKATQIARRNPEAIEADTYVLSRSRVTLKERIVQYVELRGQGMKNAEIAQKMGISIHTLHSMLNRATKQDLIIWEDPQDQLERKIAPRVVEVVEEFLSPDADEAKRLKMAIEAAKGIGLFKSHQAVRIDGEAPKAVLALNIEFTGEGGGRRGATVGVPNIIDAEFTVKDKD